MDVFATLIQILVYIISAKILADIWKTNKEVVLNKQANTFLIIIGSCLCITISILINTCLPLLNSSFINSDNLNNVDTLTFVVTTLTSVILAPLLEEVFYRRYLYEKIKSRTNVILSVIITSIIFGLIHFYGITGLLSSIFIGIILQLIYINSKKLINTIIIHGICNLSLVIIEILVLPVNYITITIFTALFLLSFITFLIILLKKSETIKFE